MSIASEYRPRGGFRAGAGAKKVEPNEGEGSKKEEAQRVKKEVRDAKLAAKMAAKAAKEKEMAALKVIHSEFEGIRKLI